MCSFPKISVSEKQIIEYLWKNNRPLTTKEIISLLPKDNKWKQNTVITFLSRLVEKKIIKATKISKANYYEPIITKQEYLNYQTKQFIREIHNGNIADFLSTIFNCIDLKKEDIDTIKLYLYKYYKINT